MDIFPDDKKRWEVNAYNDLGFLVYGSYLEETNRGWKNEKREATDVEISLWERFASKTPEIPTIRIADKLNLDGRSFESLNISTNEKCFWLENKYEMALYAHHNDYWYHYYTYLKEIRIPKNE